MTIQTSPLGRAETQPIGRGPVFGAIPFSLASASLCLAGSLSIAHTQLWPPETAWIDSHSIPGGYWEGVASPQGLLLALAAVVALAVTSMIGAVRSKKRLRIAKHYHGLQVDHLPAYARGGLIRYSLFVSLSAIALAGVIFLVGNRAAARFMMADNHLHEIAMAFDMYKHQHKQLPPSAIVGTDKVPLLSWRVHLLPKLGEHRLYEEFHLDEPWDSEHNRKLIHRMPSVYRVPGSQVADNGNTRFVLPTGEATMFPEPSASFSTRAILDGETNTILLVEVDDEHAVPWTKPADLPIRFDQPMPRYGAIYAGNYFRVLLADGTTQLLRKDAEDLVLAALFSPDDGRPVSLPR